MAWSVSCTASAEANGPEMAWFPVHSTSSLLGKLDGLRSLLAQRAYIGDVVMAQLWYPKEFRTRHPISATR